MNVVSRSNGQQRTRRIDAVRRHGGDRGCGGGCNGQGVMMKRHGGDRGCGGGAMDRVLW